MRIHFRRVKDVLSLPAHFFIKVSSSLPETFQESVVESLGILARGYYFAPRSHARKVVKDLCKVAGRSDPRAVYFGLVQRMVFAAHAFGRLFRAGVAEAVADIVRYDEGVRSKCDEIRDRYGSAIVVVPHCAGSVLSATLVSRTFPSVLLVRESKSRRRSEIMTEYLGKLGPELLFVRRASPASVARRILGAIRQHKFIIGTTDLIRRQPDTIEVEMFGRPVPLPAWPARFAARRKVPIAPVYPRISNGCIIVTMDEPIVVKDMREATQRWASCFERKIRKYPTDWPFMLEKRWACVLADAAAREERA